MTAEEIKTIVLEELRLEPNLKNVRVYDLSDWVVDTIRQDYKDSPYHINRYTLWTVFEERKDGKGYYIYFDDQSSLFGLAWKEETGTMIKIGDYGSFIKTIYAM
jgi:hypothetical protein